MGYTTFGALLWLTMTGTAVWLSRPRPRRQRARAVTRRDRSR